jgi:tetratricopeptide (TPR) repeat protein
LAETGDFDRSQQIVDMLSPIDTSGTAYYWQYEIAKIKGDNDKAFELFEEFSRKNNEEVVRILKQSISTVQRDYYQSQYQIADYKARHRKTILIFVIVSAVLIIIVIYLSTVQYKRKQEAEKDAYIRYAEEVNRQLDEFRNGTYSDLQKKYISMHKAKYETLQILFERYLQSDGRADAEKLVYKKVVSLINELKKDIENSSRFDRILDSELNGMMTNLKTEFPRLNQRYYILFGYLALGFKSPIIAHFMGCSENAVRIIKNRLKSTIKDSDAEHRADFLEVIG